MSSIKKLSREIVICGDRVIALVGINPGMIPQRGNPRKLRSSNLETVTATPTLLD